MWLRSEVNLLREWKLSSFKHNNLKNHLYYQYLEAYHWDIGILDYLLVFRYMLKSLILIIIYPAPNPSLLKFFNNVASTGLQQHLYPNQTLFFSLNWDVYCKKMYFNASHSYNIMSFFHCHAFVFWKSFDTFYLTLKISNKYGKHQRLWQKNEVWFFFGHKITV